MSSKVFREKSIERVNSPEDLNSFLRITNPPIWFALVCVILILVGAIVWACVGKVNTKVPGIAMDKNQQAVCYVSAEDISSVQVGTCVVVSGKDFYVTEIAHDAAVAEEKLTDYEMSLAGFQNGEQIYELALGGKIGTTSQAAQIIIDSVSPISFLWNSSI